MCPSLGAIAFLLKPDVSQFMDSKTNNFCTTTILRSLNGEFVQQISIGRQHVADAEMLQRTGRAYISRTFYKNSAHIYNVKTALLLFSKSKSFSSKNSVFSS